jgi:ketosteroid isomerase-like protein
MSEENVERLRRIYKRWAKGDFQEDALQLFDPYVVAVFPDPEPSPQYGLDAVRRYMRGFLGSFERMRYEAQRFREGHGSVIVDVRRSAVGKHSGLALEDEAFHVVTFRGRQIIRFDVFTDEAEALEAAGLRE